MLILAATAISPWLIIIPAALSAVGGALGGAAAMLARKDKVSETKVDYQSLLLSALQSHVDYLSKRESAREQRIDGLTKDVEECDQSKRQMQVRLDAVERRLAAQEGK